MFSKAYSQAKFFTHPLVVAIRYHDKTVESGLGAFISLNDDGWLMTAAHNFGAAFAFNQHQQELAQYNEKVEQINANTQIKEHQRKLLVQAIKPNPKWITDFAVMLAGQRIEVLEHYFYQQNDIAFIRVDKNFVKGQPVFPKIIDPNKITPGTSLCKFGFPFVEVKAIFNITTNQFDLPSNLLPVPFFPIEGIYTRNMMMGKASDGERDILFLETSSPGLKGQSGGPICDANGNIYAIQSQNITIPLGFMGTIEINKKKVEENQFFNVGIGVHPQIIVELLRKHNIKFELA